MKTECFIYIIDFHDHIKVGRTKELSRRLRALETGTGENIKRYFFIKAFPSLETATHNQLKPYRTIGEYFSCSFDIAVKEVLKIADLHGAKNKGFIYSPELKNQLKASYIFNGIKQKEAAKLLNISPQSLSNKIHQTCFKCEDLSLLVSVLDTNKCKHLFSV